MPFQRGLLTLLGGLVLLLSACARPAGSEPLLVAAASDLSGAFTAIGLAFERETGVPVAFRFGSTGLLTGQIENGAPFDVLAAADVAVLDRLQARDLILADTRALYAQGRIGIAMRPGLPAAANLQALATDPAVRRIAVANPAHAPYGRAARAALRQAGFWEALQPRIVYGKNVRDTLVLLKSGSVDAAIVARANVQSSGVALSPIDPAMHPPINQAIAVLRATDQPADARRFVRYVTGPKGAAVLRRYGFILPGEAAWAP